MQDDQKYDHQIGFAVDIDGTLVLSHEEIPGATQALNCISDNKVPYIFVTNNISHSEQTKADELNKLFPKLKVPIQADQIILNITPLKQYMHWEDKILLIIIRELEAARLPFDEMPYYITIDEYCTIFPECVPLSHRVFDEEVKKRVEKRLGVNEGSLTKQSIKFGAIMVLNAPNRWEECYQVILDHLSTEDGSLISSNKFKYTQNHIPIITALNDLCFLSKKHPLPRILIKPFNQGLRSVYKQFYKHDLKIETFGKPQRNTFTFCQKIFQKKYGKIKKLVIIGDNQETDIKGAHNAGWQSILVKIGITKHNSPLATFNCDTIIQGLKHYGLQ